MVLEDLPPACCHGAFYFLLLPCSGAEAGVGYLDIGFLAGRGLPLTFGVCGPLCVHLAWSLHAILPYRGDGCHRDSRVLLRLLPIESVAKTSWLGCM